MNKDRMLQFFDGESSHNVIELIDHLSREIVEQLPSNPERTVALRKLLECRDAALRTMDYVDV